MRKKNSLQSVFSLCIIFFLLSFLLASCRLPGLLSTSPFDSDELIAQKETIALRMTRTVEAGINPTFTPIPATLAPTEIIQCTFVWTLKQDDELSILFNAELDNDLKKVASLGAVWYGENCINMESNTLIRFYPANLDITVMLETDEEINEQWLGDHIFSLMNQIENVFAERTDLEGYPINLHFVYTLEGKYVYLDFDLKTYRQVNRENYLQGEALYSALVQ